MMIHGKTMVLFNLIAWTLLLACLVAVEVLLLDATSWLLVGIIATVMVIGFHIYFAVLFIRNRKRILALEKQYIESLKPKEPLRFCPTDDELMQSYMDSKSTQTKENSPQTKNEDAKEKTLGEEEEQEL